MLPSTNGNRGFSLIELALILGIASLLLAGFLQVYNQNVATNIINTTSANSNAIQAALGAHQLVYGFLPCPASPTLTPGVMAVNGGGQTIGAGQGDCHIANPNALPTPPAANVAACDAATNICTTPGWRASAAGLHYTGDNFTQKDPVVIGTVPYFDLGLPESASLDGYGNRFTYAVSYYDTQQASVTWGASVVPALTIYDIGAINVQIYTGGAITSGFYGKTSETPCNNLPLTGPPLLPNPNPTQPGTATNAAGFSTCWPVLYHTPGTYMVAVVSHGADGKGAWSEGGKRPNPCVQGGAPPYPAGADVENCNGDATFLLSGGNADSNLSNLIPGPNYYDDNVVLTDFTIDVDKWSVTGPNGTMSNSLGGNVGVGTGDTPGPLYPLDVNGNILVDSHLRADQLCDASGNNCFAQKLISGSGMSCNNGMMTGIANQNVTCVTGLNMTGVTPLSCPTSPLQLMNGIDVTGKPTCVLAP